MEGKNNKWYCRKKHRANIYSWGKKENESENGKKKERKRNKGILRRNEVNLLTINNIEQCIFCC